MSEVTRYDMASDYWTTGAEIEKRDMEIAALKARLAVAIKWISEAPHILGCKSRHYDTDSSWPSGEPCDCGKDNACSATPRETAP